MTLTIGLLVVIGVGSLLLGVLAAGPKLFGGTRGVTRSFWCPWRQRPVDVEFQVRAWEGECVDVSRCTAFTPPTAVECDKACLDPARLEAAREGKTAA